MKVEKKLLLPLNIQLFADGDGGNGGDGGNPPAPKTYSEEEYKKLQDELGKMKASFDKASSDLADEKKKNKAKMSEDEKKKLEDEEKDKKFKEMETELNKLKLKNSLSKTFEESEIEGIVEAIVSNDTAKLADLIVKSHEEFKKKTMEEAKKEFSKSSNIPGGSGDGKEDDDENTKTVAELAKTQSSKKPTTENKAWDNYKSRK